MRVVVDRDRCEGNAFCVNIAPEVFELDDDEYAVVKTDPIPPDQEELAEQAIAACPRAALSRRLTRGLGLQRDSPRRGSRIALAAKGFWATGRARRCVPLDRPAVSP